VSLPETPFGGYKESGVGSEGGVEGLQAFQNVKYVSRFAG
jgi:succinate-semialdehyde dehydrogenase/glutarate-semialdehyde dehydrogenase